MDGQLFFFQCPTIQADKFAAVKLWVKLVLGSADQSDLKHELGWTRTRMHRHTSHAHPHMHMRAHMHLHTHTPTQSLLRVLGRHLKLSQVRSVGSRPGDVQGLHHRPKLSAVALCRARCS